MSAALHKTMSHKTTDRIAAGRAPELFDSWVLIPAVALLCFGLVLVASASISVADRELGDAFYYVERQVVYAVLGLMAAAVAFSTPLKLWEKLGTVFLLLGMALLVLVLIPGIGVEVNGSRRWLDLVITRLQVSEAVRLCVFIYLAGYLVRRREQVEQQFSGFAKPMALLALVCCLLLAEPDFGAASVLLGAVLIMLFMAGARWRDFLLFFVLAGLAFVALAWSSPYRMQRLTAFLNPWADPFDSGFQLTQALIAIGRGQWFGVGLGEGIQKLFYLPEAHTDFVFAVMAEELGLFGVLAVIGLYATLVWRAFYVMRQAAGNGQLFGAYLACGIGAWLGLQVFINIGVNMGLLPTKGLTLPLISAGGSSLIATCAALGLLLRVAREAQAGVSGWRTREVTA